MVSFPSLFLDFMHVFISGFVTMIKWRGLHRKSRNIPPPTWNDFFFFLKCNLNVNLNFENFLCLLIVNQKSIGCCDEQEKNAFFDQHRNRIHKIVSEFVCSRVFSVFESSYIYYKLIGFFFILKKSHRDAYTKLISRNVFNVFFWHAKNLGINIATSFWKKRKL